MGEDSFDRFGDETSSRNSCELQLINHKKKLEEIVKSQIQIVKNQKKIKEEQPGFGLYAMVFITMVSAYLPHCSTSNNDLKKQINENTYELCLNQQQIQNQQAELYKTITGTKGLDFEIDCSKYLE